VTATATAKAEALKHHPITTAAAAHTVSNWLVLSVLLVSLSGLVT
jgi:IS5 family transposase